VNCIQRFEAALRLEAKDRVPAACPLQTGTIALMEASNAYWPDAHLDPEKMARLALAAYEFAGIESVRVPFHNDYESEAMGCILGGWSSESQPLKLEYAVKTVEDIDGLCVPDPLKDGKMPVVLRAVDILSEKVGNELPVIAAISAPFEMAVRIRGMTDTMRDVMLRPETLGKMLRVATETAIEYGKALIDSGASTVALIDGSASSLGPQFYVDHCLGPTREVVEELETLTVLHVCADTTSMLGDMVDTGVNGLSIDHMVDIALAKETVGEKAAIIGNVNITDTLWCGSPEMVEKEAKDCLGKGVDVLAPACGISPLTPLENMRALARAACDGQN
jgi:MtaA/CmuA family methyltransferase